MDWTPEKLAHKISTVASLPAVYLKIIETTKNPNSSIADFVTIINGDIGLSVRIMKLVNSAFFGYPSKVDSITRAVSVIGLKQLQDLALASSVMSMFKHVPEDLVTMESFWKHSIACGVIAKILANYRREFNVERAFISGLLHDIGRLVLLSAEPDLAKQIFFLAKSQNCLLYAAETDILGFSHEAVGEALLRQWQLPEQLIHAAGHHHDLLVPERFKADVALIHIADIVANALYSGSGGEVFVPALIIEAWDLLGLPVSMLEPMLLEFSQQYQEALSIVMPDANA